MKPYRICPRCKSYNYDLASFDCSNCGYNITRVKIKNTELKPKLTVKIKDEIINVMYGILELSKESFLANKDKIEKCFSDTNIAIFVDKNSYYIDVDQLSEKKREQLLSICPREQLKYYIGRAGIGCQSFEKNNYVSAIHAEFIRDNNQWYVKDCSKNGTFVNGNKISNKEKKHIKNEDIIQLSKLSELKVA